MLTNYARWYSFTPPQWPTLSPPLTEGIAGLGDVKSQIRSLFAIALAQKPGNVVVEKRPNILLYGPPGTGKTLIAAAASGSLAATFYSITAGDLLSKFFGESPQLVGKLYEGGRSNGTLSCVH